MDAEILGCVIFNVFLSIYEVTFYLFIIFFTKTDEKVNG